MAAWPYSTQRWQRLRRLKLQVNPLCEACLQVGRLEPATEIHHRTPINAGGNPYPPVDELASLCAGCHNAMTRADQLGEDYMAKGFDIFGNPLDPNHPWYRTR